MTIFMSFKRGPFLRLLEDGLSELLHVAEASARLDELVRRKASELLVCLLALEVIIDGLDELPLLLR